MDNQTAAAPSLPPPARPTSVTVFGILAILFAALGLLCSPFNLVGLNDPNNPLVNIAGFKVFAIISAINGMICAVALLAIGIGLLNLKRWARSGSVIYSVYVIIVGLIGIVAMLVILAPQIGATTDQIMKAGLVGGIIGGTVGGVIGLVFPILLLIFMRKPKAVAACCK